MTDKQPMQAMGGKPRRMSDGVEDAPGKTAGGGESGGGAYPNAQTGKKPEGGGFMGRGGQTEQRYHGGSDGAAGSGGENAVTK